MIVFLCSEFYRNTLAGLAGPAKIRVRPYRWLFARNRVPGATYVFTDHERLAHHELAAAAEAFHGLKAAGLRVLNDPARVRVRAELLDELKRSGINAFAAYRAGLRPQPQSFPVFLRSETDHRLFCADLIASQTELDERLARLEADGVPLRHLLVIEFMAAPIREGVYKKHSVFRVGERFLGYTPVVEDNWQVKYGKRGLSTAAELDAAVAEIDANPHAEALKPAFAAARIDYGRADFGFVGSRLSVFEINTNPALAERIHGHHHAAYQAACERMRARILEAICALDSSGPRTAIPWRRPWLRRNKPFAGFLLKQP